MLFNSTQFLIFFPVVLLIYYILPSKIRYIWLLISSYYFYMCWNPAYIILILISTGITYICAILVGMWKDNSEDDSRRSRLWMKLTIAMCFTANLSLLIYFKYTNFLVDIVNQLLGPFNIAAPKFDILLPVGISFYTFQALGYTIDVYRGRCKAEKNILKYALFVSFFPQLVAGPIERSESLLAQIHNEPERKLWNYERITVGLTTMLWGFFIKIVIADRVAILVDTVFASYESYQMTALVAGAVGFALQIYCDFAGYSTIAVGAAKVLGFELMENFDTPYFAQSVTDFWHRWHISLSSWFRDYLYIPLGGSRCSKIKNYRNILLTFTISGLWHGAGWNYIVWGACHGIYQIAEKEFGTIFRRINERCNTKVSSFGYRFFKVVLTFVLVDIAWIFFRADSLSQAVHYIQRMFLYRDWWSLFDLSIYNLGLDIQEMNILLFGVILLFLADLLRYKKKISLAGFLKEQWVVFRFGVLLCLLFCCIIFGCYGTGFDSAQFIYFQF